VSQSHHQPKRAISHLQELEGREEAKESSKGMTSSLHGAEACCKEVDFAPTNHREKREMAEKEITTQHNSPGFPPGSNQSKGNIWDLILYMERTHRDSYKTSTLCSIAIRLSYTIYAQQWKHWKRFWLLLQMIQWPGLLLTGAKQKAFTKQLHTSVSFLCSLKPVDLCTPLYHQGAHKPSIGLGPASQLTSLKLSCQFPYMYALTLLYSSSFNIN